MYSILRNAFECALPMNAYPSMPTPISCLSPAGTVREILGRVKTSLGIWAFGPMVTRFVPGGYKPELAGETTVRRVRRAVEGLGELIDGYEFHYPQELSEENLDEVREALEGHDVYCMATGLHLDSRFGRGGLVSPDDATRAEAVRRTLAAIDFSGSIGAHFIIWPGIEGYNYPFQTPYRETWAWLLDGVGQAAERCREHGILLFLEHKNSEPAMNILMRNVGMTLHVIHKLRAQGLDNVKVNMDWQHLIMNGENLGEYAALLAAEGVLGHQHANSGWGTFDDDNMVGATRFMETLELAVELRRVRYGENGERLGFDLYPYTEDAVAAVRRSVLHWRFIDSIAAKLVDDADLRAAQMRKDAVAAYEVVYGALGGE
jgi:xylose isomerase